MRYRQYIRVSSKAQLRGASLEDQERANVARVGQLGGTIEHTYTEPGRSAFTENLGKRQAFQQMLTDARARRFDALIIYDLSRFSRQAAVALTVAADLERLGITVISATEYFDRTTAAGRMTFTMLAAAAQFKSDHLSERMRAVRRSTAERGILPGPVPVGYRRIDGRLEQTPAAEAVRVAFQMYCTGDYGSMRITDAMNATGHTMPDGTPFKVTAVDEILHNPIYAGFVPCGERLYPGLHEPIIDAATWERAQEVAAARAKRRPQPQRRATRSSRASPYARAAVPRCGTPGGPEHPYYMCSAHTTRATTGYRLTCLFGQPRAMRRMSSTPPAPGWLASLLRRACLTRREY
jgi:site-specific DNA recombinase